MADEIIAGTILMQEGSDLPSAQLLQRESHSSGWAAATNALSSYDHEIQEAGWTFFFMAGEIQANVFGSDPRKASCTALKRLIALVKAQNCNSIEITRVTQKSFLKIPYVTVYAHARHLQKGTTFSG